MLKTFIISLVLMAVSYFFGNKIGPYTPWGVKVSKNKWISGSAVAVLFIFALVHVGATIVAWFIFVAFTLGKLFVFLRVPGWFGLMALAVAWFGPILWWWYDGKLPSVDPHSWGCGDKGPP